VDLAVTPKSAHSRRSTISLAVRVRITAPEQLDELVEFLQREGDASIAYVSDEELEVSLLGSYSHDAMRMELYLRLRAWEASLGARRPRVEILG
jgi:hypothetical protein